MLSTVLWCIYAIKPIINNNKITQIYCLFQMKEDQSEPEEDEEVSGDEDGEILTAHTSLNITSLPS